MNIYVIVLLAMVNHVAYKGGKMLLSLYAIELGASPFQIGLIFSLMSVCSLTFALTAGRVSDRWGPRVPMLLGCSGMSLSLLLPYFMPSLPVLYITAVLAGLYIFFTVSLQHLVGGLGTGQERTRKISLYTTGLAITALVSPVTTGFSIDNLGHQWTCLLLGLLPLGFIAFLLFCGHALPHLARHTRRREHHTMDLIRNGPLRRMLIVAAIAETGGELFSFYMPIYGHSIGLSASRIGVIIATYAVAVLVVRTMMPYLVKRSDEVTALFGSLVFGTFICVLFPLVTNEFVLAAISFLLGLGLGCCMPLSLTLVYNRSPEGRSGEAVGLRQAVTKISEISVPLTAGSLAGVFGIAPVFWLVAILLAGGAVVMKADVTQRFHERRLKQSST